MFDCSHKKTDALTETLVKDDFFNDPDMIRRLALACDYKNCDEHEKGGNWPGFRTTFLNQLLGKDVFDDFMNKLFDMIKPDGGINDYYLESYFHFCTEEDGNSWPHQDSHTVFQYASLIYLTPDPK